MTWKQVAAAEGALGRFDQASQQFPEPALLRRPALRREARVHLVPVLLGGGTPLFATLESAVRLERTQVVATPAATHLDFRVVR